MKKFLLAVVVIYFACSVGIRIQAQFVEVPASIKTTTFDDIDWGDFDNDGDLDLVTIGFFDGKPVTDVYKNNGGELGLHKNLAIGVFMGSCDWGDFDNDGDLDLLLMGATSGLADKKPTTCIYINAGGNFSLYSISQAQLPKVSSGEARWADMNNDGALDIVINADEASIYISDGKGNFAKGPEFPWSNNFLNGNPAGDFDSDGDLDLVLGDGADGLLAVYRNNGNLRFEKIDIGIVQSGGGKIRWSDMDHDGDLDLIISGNFNHSPAITVYQNVNGVFTAVENVQPLSYVDRAGATALGDYDNDGDTDILASWDSYDNSPDALIISNDGIDRLTPTMTELPSVTSRSAAWVDFDNDHDMDVHIGHLLLRNDIQTKNTPPLPPSIVQVDSVYNNVVYFQWNAGSDHATSADGLSYQLYVGKQSKKQNVVGANADLITGVRKLSEPGNMKHRRYTLHNLKAGTYFFGVQSVDASYEGSVFSDEKQFVLIRLAGKTTTCQNSNDTYTALPVGNYIWEVNGGTIVSGQGTSNLVVKWDSTGSGYIKASNGLGSKSTLSVHVDQVPAASIAGDFSVCTGVEAYTVSVSATDSIEWVTTFPNEATVKGPLEADILWVGVSQQPLTVRAHSLSRGCVFETTTNVLVDVRPTPSVSGEDESCLFDTKEYTKNASRVEWQVRNGQIKSQSGVKAEVEWTAVGFGSVIVVEESDRAFCTSSDSLTVEVLRLPGKPTITLVQDSILVSSPSPSGFYRWYFNDETVFLDFYQAVIPLMSGAITVEIFTKGLRCPMRSDPFIFMITDVEESSARDEGSLIVFPNPAVHSISIDLTNYVLGQCQIEVYSSQGKLVHRRTYKSSHELNTDELDISALSSDVYTVKVTSNNVTYLAKFVKK